MKKVGSLSKALDKYKDMNASVRVGVLEDATYPDGTSVAQVAFWNEYGTSRADPRPFFRYTVNENRKNWVLSTKNLMKLHKDPKQVMGLMGEHIKGQIVQSIVSWSDPPNAPYTIAKKGFNKPLIDSGQMSRSISWELNEE
jgi:hypothetical protein